jgi:hypothetical protein
MSKTATMQPDTDSREAGIPVTDDQAYRLSTALQDLALRLQSIAGLAEDAIDAGEDYVRAARLVQAIEDSARLGSLSVEALISCIRGGKLDIGEVDLIQPWRKRDERGN